MQLNVEKLLLSDPATLRGWFVYRDAEDEAGEAPFELELRCSTAEEQTAFLRRHGKKDPTLTDWRVFWMEHVLGWRGLRDGDKEVEFTRELLELLWKRDAEFGPWVARTCQRLDNFR